MADFPSFKDYFINKFKEWEDKQTNRRTSVSAFARWLSDNSFNIIIKQPLVEDWRSGHIPKTEKYIYVLAEKLGDDVYDILNYPRPNPYLQKVNRLWEFIPESVQKRLAEEAEIYETKNETLRVQKIPERKKVAKNK